MDMLAAQNLRGRGQVFQAAVGAGANESHIDMPADHLRERLDVVHAVRAGYQGLKLVEMQVIFGSIAGPFVGINGLRFDLWARNAGSGGQEIENSLVGRQVGILDADFRHGVGDYHAAFQRQAVDPRAGKFQRIIQPAVRTQGLADLQAQILGRHARGQVAVQIDPQAFRHAQPQAAGIPQGGHFAAAHARSEGPQPAVMGAVAVRAQDQVTGQYQALFGNHLVADAAPHFEEMPDALRLDELARLGMVLGMFRRGRRRGVIEHHAQPFRVRHPFGFQFIIENVGDGSRVVMGQDAVRPDDQDVAGMRLGHPGGARQGFFSKGQGSHGSGLLGFG